MRAWLPPLLACCAVALVTAPALAGGRRPKPTKGLEVAPAVPPPPPPTKPAPEKPPEPPPAATPAPAAQAAADAGWVEGGSITASGIELFGALALGAASPSGGGTTRTFLPLTPGLSLWISDPQTFMRLDVSYLLLGMPNLLDSTADPLLVDLVLPRTGEVPSERGAHNHYLRFRSGRALTQPTQDLGIGAALILDWGNLGSFPAGALANPVVGGDSFAVGLGPAVAWVPLNSLAVYASADVEVLARFSEPWLRGVGFAVDGDIIYNLVPRLLSMRGGVGVSTRFFLDALGDPAPGSALGFDANLGVILQWDWLFAGSGGAPPTW